jgi:hypothetical protein
LLHLGEVLKIKKEGDAPSFFIDTMVCPAGIELSSKSLYFWVIDISCGVDISPFISLFMKGLILLRCNVDVGSDPK